ncbi:hypothetical protein E2C01_036349 [Portunus trituberculatus]|uniref:Uncharacterized protein n=1 Tax=Portunus trituberculatus TaxID=210409 RepID=A0A5B7F6H6_PORTR|nr:hypothetical protein [Portunus trituberculatus]
MLLAHRDGWVSSTETVIIPGKISIIPHQVSSSVRVKTPEAPPFSDILRRDCRHIQDKEMSL